jgi:23S rRNA maturation mini-RNase III
MGLCTLKKSLKMPKGVTKMTKQKRTKEQIMIPKTLHRKLIIEQQESLSKRGVNTGAPEG